MAYTTDALEGIKAYTKVAANGKYYFGGTFETKKSRIEDDYLGTLKGEMDFEGSKIISVSDTDFGTLYYLASKLYLVDEFGNRLELNANGDWDVVGIVDLQTTNDSTEVGYDNGWGDTTGAPNNTNKKTTVGGWLGGITDVLKGANDLLKGSNNATDSNNFDPEADSPKNNTVLYIIIALVIIIIGVIIYLLTSKKKPPVQSLTVSQPTQPLSGIHKPKRIS